MVEDEVANRLEDVRCRVAEACGRRGRDPGDVTLVGISKRQPMERIRAAIAAGLRVLGESLVQEAAVKIPECAAGLSWQLVGHLQSNKVKAAVRLFDVIHSIDRLKIARRIEREARLQDRRIEGFVQVNLGAEASKHGFAADGLATAIRPLADLERVRIVGLMAIPPYEEDVGKARSWFCRLRQLRDEIGSRAEWGAFPGLLSMGMSHDFETAIEEGSTHVRVGTSIFGERPETLVG